MMKSEQPIAILMATYNGEKYLREQLDSILVQTYCDWELFVHDDGSTDGTMLILRDYAARYPDKVVLMDYPPQGGACKNFESLLRRVEAEYYMFADQDDVWLEDKVEHSLCEMKRSETEGKAVLVCTDVKVVDKNLEEISPSLWSIAGIYPELICCFDDMAGNTVATGSTMLFNEAAKQCVLPMTQHTTMHDAWIACCVMKAGGEMIYLRTATMLYRQHGGNTLGAKDVTQWTLLDRIRNVAVSWQINKAHYLMLRDLGYGSIVKYIKNKWKYHKLGVKYLAR